MGGVYNVLFKLTHEVKNTGWKLLQRTLESSVNMAEAEYRVLVLLYHHSNDQYSNGVLPCINCPATNFYQPERANGWS